MVSSSPNVAYFLYVRWCESHCVWKIFEIFSSFANDVLFIPEQGTRSSFFGGSSNSRLFAVKMLNGLPEYFVGFPVIGTFGLRPKFSQDVILDIFTVRAADLTPQRAGHAKKVQLVLKLCLVCYLPFLNNIFNLTRLTNIPTPSWANYSDSRPE